MNYDEMRALCAESMGVELEGYDPHKNDSQLIDLAKKLHIEMRPSFANGKHVIWVALAYASDAAGEYAMRCAYHFDLSRAVVMCASEVFKEQARRARLAQ